MVEEEKKVVSDTKLSYPKREFECYTIHLERKCHELCGFASKYHKGSAGSSGIYCGMWLILHSKTEEHEKWIKRFNIDMNDYNMIKS